MTLLETFVYNVKQERIKQGLSQEKLAELSNLHRTYISFLERGKRNVTLNTIEKLSKALNVDAITLLTDKREEDA